MLSKKNSRFKTYIGLGWVFYHMDGIACYPDTILEIEYPLKENQVIGEGEEMFDNIIASYEEHDLELVQGVTSIRRFRGVYLSYNMGTYWTDWGYGDSKEEALEMLDDKYGVLDDLLK